MYEDLREPKLDFVNLVGVVLIYLGCLLFLTSLHILTIETTGDLSSVLNTTFIVFVAIYSFAVIFGFVIVIVKMLKWAAWLVNMPVWKKEKIRRGGQ